MLLWDLWDVVHHVVGTVLQCLILTYIAVYMQYYIMLYSSYIANNSQYVSIDVSTYWKCGTCSWGAAIGLLLRTRMFSAWPWSDFPNWKNGRFLLRHVKQPIANWRSRFFSSTRVKPGWLRSMPLPVALCGCQPHWMWPGSTKETHSRVIHYI